VYQLTEQVTTAVQRLKDAGFVTIGIGRDELFHGFASRDSCNRFLTESALDDVIIPHGNEPCHSGLIQAAAKWLLDLDQSFFIGWNEDELSDANTTGCRSFRIHPFADGNVDQNQLSELIDRILCSADVPSSTLR